MANDNDEDDQDDKHIVKTCTNGRMNIDFRFNCLTIVDLHKYSFPPCISKTKNKRRLVFH